MGSVDASTVDGEGFLDEDEMEFFNLLVSNRASPPKSLSPEPDLGNPTPDESRRQTFSSFGDPEFLTRKLSKESDTLSAADVKEEEGEEEEEEEEEEEDFESLEAFSMVLVATALKDATA